ncbi:MAG: hypothetical protein JWP06_912 [Candidatus Saccharibacteria bacterium]|nr:hypothetical protein [Candidatus Saccharibacteria bacterium]
MYGYKDDSSGSTKSTDYSLLDRSPSETLLYVMDELDTLPTESRVLDLGCGDGTLEHHAGSNRNYSFTSIDLEPAAIDKLQETFLEQENGKDIALVGDITKLDQMTDIKDEKYDVVVSWRVLHGIAPEYYRDIFKNIHDLLKPNAKVFITVASSADWKAVALGDTYSPQGINDCSGIMFRNYGIERHTPFPVHFFSKEELQTIGEENGFTLKAVSTFEEPSGYAHLQDRLNTYIFAEFTLN